MNSWIAALICVILVVGKLGLACFLEWKLAKKEEWYLGLILPVLLFGDSLGRMMAEYEAAGAGLFLRLNVTTILLLLLYGFQRIRLKQKREYAQMKLKDL
ncbi:hypothetical protein [Anaerotignum sp.]